MKPEHIPTAYNYIFNAYDFLCDELEEAVVDEYAEMIKHLKEGLGIVLDQLEESIKNENNYRKF